MARRTLLGALVKRQPHYMNLLMKPHNYEEFFMMNQWVGFVAFTKKNGTSNDAYHKYISSFITIQDEDTVYQEHIEHFLIPSLTFMPIVVQSTWKKNKVKITSKAIPSEIYRLLERKHPIDTVYSSHPL
jgi:hypothetical protein